MNDLTGSALLTMNGPRGILGAAVSAQGKFHVHDRGGVNNYRVLTRNVQRQRAGQTQVRVLARWEVVLL